MSKIAFVVAFCLCGLGLSAEMKDFEQPPDGLKVRIAEYWNGDPVDVTTEHFDRKVTETFNAKGELVSREYFDSSGKTEKLTYRHVYDNRGQIIARAEVDAKGKILQSWSYRRTDGGKLEIKMRMVLSSGDMVYVYRFDKVGRLEELECLECSGSKTKLVNHYTVTGQLKDQLELVEGRHRYATEFEYDKDGNLRRAIRRNHMNYLATEQEYNAVGALESRTEYDYYGDDVVARESHEYEYDDAGLVTKDDWMDAKIEHRKFVVKRGRTYYKYEFHEKK